MQTVVRFVHPHVFHRFVASLFAVRKENRADLAALFEPVHALEIRKKRDNGSLKREKPGRRGIPTRLVGAMYSSIARAVGGNPIAARRSDLSPERLIKL